MNDEKDVGNDKCFSIGWVAAQDGQVPEGRLNLDSPRVGYVFNRPFGTRIVSGPLPNVETLGYYHSPHPG